VICIYKGNKKEKKNKENKIIMNDICEKKKKLTFTDLKKILRKK
jgi:hypothetical protein